MCIFAKKPIPPQMELAYSIGLGYPLISCSSAEPISVSPNNTNLVKSLTDTVHFTLPSYKGKVTYKLRSITSPQNKTVYQLTLMQMRYIVLYNMLQNNKHKL